MYTIFSAVLRQQRKSDVMTSFGDSACSAVYYKAGFPFFAHAALVMTLAEAIHCVVQSIPGMVSILSILSREQACC
jgi:hypothetical protein